MKASHRSFDYSLDLHFPNITLRLLVSVRVAFDGALQCSWARRKVYILEWGREPGLRENVSPLEDVLPRRNLVAVGAVEKAKVWLTMAITQP